MPPQLIAQLKRAGAAVNGLSLGQKVLAVLGIGILVLGGTALTTWVSQPTYAPLFTQLAAADASAITGQLTTDGVPFQLADGGATVLVPVQSVDAERIKVAAAGLPKSTATGYALLDAQGVTASQFQQKVAYQRAVEGELAKTIEGIDGINTAVVHLAIPEQTVFTDSAGTPTASVLVEQRAGYNLTDAQVQSIIHLVSASVPGLAADQITVSDSRGKLLSAAGQGATGSSDDETAAYEQKTAASVQAMLDKVLGPGKAMASVNAALNYDKTSTTSETFSTTPGVPPLSQTSSKEVYAGGAGNGVGGALGANGVLGVDGTTTTGTSGTATGTTSGNGYTKASNTQDNAVNKVTEHKQAALGAVKRQSVAVVVDATAAGKAGLPQLQQMVAAAAGVDTTRGDTLSVTTAPFDTTAADQAKNELAAAKASKVQAAQMSLIQQGAIGLAVLLAVVLALVVWARRAKARRREPVDLGELERLYTPAPAQEPVAIARVETVPQLVAPQPDSAALRRAEFGELVDNQPAEVAELLRGWLATSKKG